MKKMITCLVAAIGLACGVMAQAEVFADVSSIIAGSGLNNLQKKALTQYADSLDQIVSVSLTDRSAVINTNKDFMRAQQCLAEVYGIDQKPDMMRVSRKIFNTVFSNDDLMRQYHKFLGQARQEGDNALPGDAKACR